MVTARRTAGRQIRGRPLHGTLSASDGGARADPVRGLSSHTLRHSADRGSLYGLLDTNGTQKLSFAAYQHSLPIEPERHLPRTLKPG